MSRIQGLRLHSMVSALLFLIVSFAPPSVNCEASSNNGSPNALLSEGPNEKLLWRHSHMRPIEERYLFELELIPFGEEVGGSGNQKEEEEEEEEEETTVGEQGDPETDVEEPEPSTTTEEPHGDREDEPLEGGALEPIPLTETPPPAVVTEAPTTEAPTRSPPLTETPAPAVVTEAPTKAPTRSPTQAPLQNEFVVTRSPTDAPKPEDFAKFNDILKDAVLSFPDLNIQEDIIYQPLSISLTEFECSRINFEDIKVDSYAANARTIHIGLEVVNLALNCEFDFRWSYIFLSGQGHALVTTGGSSVLAGLDVFSDGFDQFPPETADVTMCETDINILGLSFSGNIASQIFNLFEQVIIDVVGSLINDKICVELNGMGADMLASLFNTTQELVDPYFQPIEEWRLNASYPELHQMEIGENTSLLSWNYEDGYGQFLAAGLDEVDELMSSLREDTNAPDDLSFPNGTKYPEGYDLGINVLLREYLLEDDRAFELNMTTFDMNDTVVLYEGQDKLTDVKISLMRVKVYGLDTFSRMKPFTRIGNFTLFNDLAWAYIQVELEMLMEVKASSLEDSIIRDPERIDPYVEDFKISIGIEDFDIGAAILLALEPDQMRALKVGPLLDLPSMIPCVLSSLYDFSFTKLNVTIGDIALPSIEGLVSPGLDRVLTDAVEAAFLMYKGTLLRAVPAIFETTIRDLLSETIQNATCPGIDTPEEDSYVDLRDLLLDPDESRAIGGTGDAQYGDLASTIYGILRGMWLEFEEDGTLGLNRLFIGPITEATSGAAGLVSIPGELYNFTLSDENEFDLRTLVKKFEFGIYDLRIENLDTAVHPMSVIEPINHPYITETTLNVGPVRDRPLFASIDMLMALDIEDSPLAMNNLIKISFSVSSVEIFIEALTMFSANNLLNFRLGDGLDISCWFAMLPPPKLDYQGFRVEGTDDRGIELRRLFAKISGLQLGIECVGNCSSGLASLPDVVDIFDRTQVTSILAIRLPLFLEEIAISEPFQVAFDRWLTDAPYSCPHRIEYDPEYKRPSNWGFPEFKTLSVESSDTIFFTTVVAAQVAFVLLVETHYPWGLNTLAPLSGQQSFVPLEGSNIIDWMDLDGKAEGGFDALAEDARAYLRDQQAEANTNATDLGINVLLRDFLINEDGVIDFVPLFSDGPIEFSIVGLGFRFHAIKVRGLDSFTNFEALQPIAPQTILNSMHLDFLDIELEVSTGSSIDPPQIITAKFHFEDINATVPLFAAFDLDKLVKIEFGHLMTLGHIFPCLMSASNGIHFPQVLMSIGNFTPPTFEGFLPDSGEALRKSIQEMYERYAQKTIKALPVMFDTSIRAFVNTFIAEYLDEKAKCTHITEKLFTNATSAARNLTLMNEEVELRLYQHDYDGYVDFRELLLHPDDSAALGGMGYGIYGDLIRSLTLPIREELLKVNPTTKLSGVNNLIAPITKIISGEEGTFFYDGDIVAPVELEAGIGSLNALITFGLSDLRIENMGTIGDPLALANPVVDNPQLLNHSAGIGISEPLRVTIRPSIKIQTTEGYSGGGLDTNIINDFSLSLELTEAQAIFNTFVMVSESYLVHFPLSSVTNPWCWLSLISDPELDRRGVRPPGVDPTLAFRDLLVQVAALNLNLTCISCSTSGMQNLSDAFLLPESTEAVTKVANKILDFGSRIVTGNLVQDAIDRALKEAPRRCPHLPDYAPDAASLRWDPLNFDRTLGASPLLLKLVLIGLGLLGAVAAFVLFVKWIVWRRSRKWLQTLPARQVHILERQQEAAKQMEKEMNDTTKAMVISDDIPLHVRYLMPLIVCGNIAFFLSGHLSIAAETRLEAKIAGEPFTLDKFFQFSVLMSMEDMWTADAKEMAIFIMIFALIWPYVKQFTTLFCWVLPPSTLSISRRGSIYLWLDTLAKWSMVDIFVLLISMIAFRINAITPEVPFLPDDFFSLRVYIVPLWGLYANLIAQMISQVSSHYIIHYHRAIVKRATKDYEERHQTSQAHQALTVQTASDSDEKSDGAADSSNCKRLCDNAFTRPHKGHISKLVVRKGAGYVLLLGTCILIVCLFLGCAISSVGVQVQGLISFVSGASGVYKEFDVFSIAKLLMDDARHLDDTAFLLAYLFLALVVLSSVFFVPFFQSLALVYHWFKPMTDKERKRFSRVIEILAAWQYAEVFILALFVSAWQLAPTSETVMAEQCEDFEPIFEMMTYYGILDREDGHCFRVEAFILEGSYLMATGAFLLAVSNSFVMKASAQYFWDKETTRKALAMEKQVPEDIYGDVTKEELKKIGPPPVLFTDTYRWVLRRENLGDTGGRLPRSSIAMLSAPPESAQPDPEYISTSSGAS